MILSLLFICSGAASLYYGIALVGEVGDVRRVAYFLDVVGVAAICIGIVRPLILLRTNAENLIVQEENPFGTTKIQTQLVVNND